MNNITIFKSNFLNKESTLSEFATSSSKAIRLINEDISNEIRPPFFHDIDRIIYSLSYTRYLDKTQVFTDSGNDNISKRITHVQFVSKVARTIGRALNLNEDLIEAIALGHDIGHTPLGHSGEAMLNEISLRELGEYFAHNIESVRDLMFIENNGEGLNLTVQVYDGIMCHNGEILEPIYRPQEKDIEEFLREYNLAYKDLQASKKFRPMTLEGCVVRISDIIGYIGRDIEDAIMIGLIKREDIPKTISSVLGSTNREIINNIIMDIKKELLKKDTDYSNLQRYLIYLSSFILFVCMFLQFWIDVKRSNFDFAVALGIFIIFYLYIVSKNSVKFSPKSNRSDAIFASIMTFVLLIVSILVFLNSNLLNLILVLTSSIINFIVFIPHTLK